MFLIQFEVLTDSKDNLSPNRDLSTGSSDYDATHSTVSFGVTGLNPVQGMDLICCFLCFIVLYNLRLVEVLLSLSSVYEFMVSINSLLGTG